MSSKIQNANDIPNQITKNQEEQKINQKNDDLKGNQNNDVDSEPQEQKYKGKNKTQAEMFKKYLQQTGIAMAFQVIFAQILDKKIQQAKVFSYTAMRLRQIGDDLQKIKLTKK